MNTWVDIRNGNYMVRLGMFEVTHIKRLGIKRGVKLHMRNMISTYNFLGLFKVREGLLYRRGGDGEVLKSAQRKKMLHEKQVPLNARSILSLVRGRQERKPKMERFISPIA